MQRSYIGLQGIAAGPVKIGPAGPWLLGNIHPTADNPNRKVLEVTDDIQGTVLLSMRAGYTSSADDNSVVTVKYLKDHYVSATGTVPTVDLTDYVTHAQLNLVATQVNNNTIAANNALSMGQANAIQLNSLTKNLSEVQSLALSNSASISNLNARFDNLTYDPFGEPVLLVAGNARGES